MKPHEETWDLEIDDDTSTYLVTPDGRKYLFGDYDLGCASDPSMDAESTNDDQARARLAAQAPAMARCLAEWRAILLTHVPKTIREGEAIRVRRDLAFEQMEQCLRDAGVLE